MAQAPYEYVRDYYEYYCYLLKQQSDITNFWLSKLKLIKGKRVLNVGCGPQFYDYALKFWEMPEKYLGVDINQATFDFLDSSNHPQLLEFKAKVEKCIPDIQLINADIFDYAKEMKQSFDVIAGIGVFGTYHGERFQELMKLMRDALTDDGMLYNTTWHGAYRTPEEHAKKHLYRFDSEQEYTVKELVDAIEQAGFRLDKEFICQCDPVVHKWNSIHVCTFKKY